MALLQASGAPGAPLNDAASTCALLRGGASAPPATAGRGRALLLGVCICMCSACDHSGRSRRSGLGTARASCCSCAPNARRHGQRSAPPPSCPRPCWPQVYKGRRRCTGQITAMKFIVKHGKSEKDIRNLRQEIEILRHLRHENIIQMLDAFETRDHFVVVMGAHPLPRPTAGPDPGPGLAARGAKGCAGGCHRNRQRPRRHPA
jgi:hypothetical protein